MTATTITATTTERRARRRARPRRSGASPAAVAALLIALAGCGGGDDEAGGDGEGEGGTRVGAEEVYPGELHECAGDWPVPEEMTVVETARGRDQAGEPTCVVSVRSGRPVTETVGRYRSELEAAGWAHETQQEDESAAVLQLHGPLCGAVIVIPQDEGALVLASVLDCDRVRDRPAGPPGTEG